MTNETVNKIWEELFPERAKIFSPNWNTTNAHLFDEEDIPLAKNKMWSEWMFNIELPNAIDQYKRAEKNV